MRTKRASKPDKRKPKAVIVIEAPHELVRAAKEKAKAEDRSLSSLVRVAITTYLKQDREPAQALAS